MLERAADLLLLLLSHALVTTQGARGSGDYNKALRWCGARLVVPLLSGSRTECFARIMWSPLL